MADEHTYLLQRVQPAMVGLIDGSLSTLAPIFGIALATHDPRFAFIAGLVTALGAAPEVQPPAMRGQTIGTTGSARRNGRIDSNDGLGGHGSNSVMRGRSALRD